MRTFALTSTTRQERSSSPNGRTDRVQGGAFEAGPREGLGRGLLKAIRFAFWQLGRRDPGFTRENTLVIATEARRAAGPSSTRPSGTRPPAHTLIDAVVAREPQVQLKPDDQVVVARGGVERSGSGRTLLDYFTFGNLYQPCAVLAVPDIPLKDRIGFAANRCASLHDKDSSTRTRSMARRRRRSTGCTPTAGTRTRTSATPSAISSRRTPRRPNTPTTTAASTCAIGCAATATVRSTRTAARCLCRRRSLRKTSRSRLEARPPAAST